MRIETERLIIREFTSKDVQHVHVYAKDPVVSQYMAWGPNSMEDTVGFINRAMDTVKEEPRTTYELAIEDKSTGLIIGGTGITIIDSDGTKAEIGYSINPTYWLKGYATEAARAIVDFGFDYLQVHRIRATCDVRNLGSAKVLEKCGMVREGLMRSHMKLRDGWRDSYLYAIVEEDERY